MEQKEPQRYTCCLCEGNVFDIFQVTHHWWFGQWVWCCHGCTIAAAKKVYENKLKGESHEKTPDAG